MEGNSGLSSTLSLLRPPSPHGPSAAALADAWRDAGCPMSGHLVAAEYAKRRVALACPACVGAAAREVRYE